MTAPEKTAADAIEQAIQIIDAKIASLNNSRIALVNVLELLAAETGSGVEQASRLPERACGSPLKAPGKAFWLSPEGRHIFNSLSEEFRFKDISATPIFRQTAAESWVSQGWCERLRYGVYRKIPVEQKEAA